MPSDIIEQQHFDRNNSLVTDYLMFIDAGMLPAERFTFIKLLKTDDERQPSVQNQTSNQTWTNSSQSLTVVGFTADDQVLFSYRNGDQEFEQSFGINLKKYMAHQAREPLLWRSQLDFANLTEAERQDKEVSEGVYTFLPQWDDQLPHPYGKLVQDISY